MSLDRYRIIIDPVGGFVVANFGGQLTLNDMLCFVKDLYSHEEYKSSLLTVYDFKLSSAICYRIDVISFVEHLKKLNWGSKRRKIGFIVGSINQRFLIRTFMVLTQGLNFDVEMFENKEACINWITEDVDIKKKIMLSINYNRNELFNQLNSEISD